MEVGGGWSVATVSKIAACAAAAGYIAYRLSRNPHSHPEHTEQDTVTDAHVNVATTIAPPTRKTVPVCLRVAAGPAAKLIRATVDLDLTVITCWGEPLVAALAAGVGVDPAAVNSVWLREDDDEEPDRLDDRPKRSSWRRVLSMDSEKAVLLLDIATTTITPHPALPPATAAVNPGAAVPAPLLPLRGLGDDDEVEYSPEDQQNYERLNRLFLKDPRSIVCALQDVSTRVHVPILGFNGGPGW